MPETAVEPIIGLALIAVAIAFYFAPSVIALMRRHANMAPILIVNIFLGWTFIGWIVALAWAFSSQEAPRGRRGY